MTSEINRFRNIFNLITQGKTFLINKSGKKKKSTCKAENTPILYHPCHDQAVVCRIKL